MTIDCSGNEGYFPPMKKLIIIPAYNESESIEYTIQSIAKNAPGFDYIIINDCSTDHTEQICRDKNFEYLTLPVNLGIGGAVQTGYRYACEMGYDIIVQVDGDGQHDVRYLARMEEVMQHENADMVIGSRFIEREGFQSSAVRRIGIGFFTGLIKVLTGRTITDPTSGFRMVNRKTAEIFAEDYPRDYPEPESTVFLLCRKKKVVEVPVIMHERTGGTSSIRFKKSVYYMVKVSLAILIERFRI